MMQDKFQEPYKNEYIEPQLNEKYCNQLGIALLKTKLFLALEPRSSLQGGGNGSHTSLIELAEHLSMKRLMYSRVDSRN
jgi:hypothetical protein